MTGAGKSAGWNISDQDGDNTVLRIYEGYTAPLLRSFLMPLDLSAVSKTVVYNGKEQTLALPLGVVGNAAKGTAVGTLRVVVFSLAKMVLILKVTLH